MNKNLPQLEDGYTRIANKIIEAMCQLKISNYESRFLWALFRKTYGYGQKKDRISLSQFSKLTGIASHHIARTKTKLLSKGIIYEINNQIGFQKDISKWGLPKEVVPKQVVPKQGAGSTQTGSKVVPKQVHTKEKKETIQKKGELFIEYFNEKTNRQFRVTNDRKNKLRLRLKTFTLEEVLKAVDNFVEWDWYKKHYDDRWVTPDYLIRSDEQIEKFIADQQVIQTKNGKTRITLQSGETIETEIL
jgi:phage replication O-like protein O